MMDETEIVEQILSRISSASEFDSEFLADIEHVHRELTALTADDMYKQFSI